MLESYYRDLVEGTPRQRWVATAQLVAAGAPAVPLFVRALGSAATDVRLAALSGIAQLGPVARAAARPLVAQLTHEERLVRCDALHALLRIAAPMRWALSALVRALDDESPMVRPGAARALGLMGAAARDAAPHLERALAGTDRRDAWFRLHAAVALWRVAGPQAATVRALRALLASDVKPVPAHAARALARLRPATPDAVEALQVALASRDRFTRHHARSGLKSPARRRGAPPS